MVVVLGVTSSIVVVVVVVVAKVAVAIFPCIPTSPWNTRMPYFPSLWVPGYSTFYIRVNPCSNFTPIFHAGRASYGRADAQPINGAINRWVDGHTVRPLFRV